MKIVAVFVVEVHSQWRMADGLIWLQKMLFARSNTGVKQCQYD